MFIKEYQNTEFKLKIARQKPALYLGDRIWQKRADKGMKLSKVREREYGGSGSMIISVPTLHVLRANDSKLRYIMTLYAQYLQKIIFCNSNNQGNLNSN